MKQQSNRADSKIKQIMTPDGQEGSDEKLEFGSVESNAPRTPEDKEIEAARVRRSPSEIERDFSYGDVPEVKTVSDEVDSGKVHAGTTQNPRRLDH